MSELQSQEKEVWNVGPKEVKLAGNGRRPKVNPSKSLDSYSIRTVH